MFNENKSLTDKLATIDELSKSYQRIVSVNKDRHSDKVYKIENKILNKIDEVVDSIKQE